MRPELPTGTVTFLFTDVEGSTRLLRELGAEGAQSAMLTLIRRRIRETRELQFTVVVPCVEGAFSWANTFIEARTAASKPP